MKFNFKRFFYKNKISNEKLFNLSEEVNIKEIKKTEYISIFENEKIINLSHIQSPDYYQDM